MRVGALRFLWVAGLSIAAARCGGLIAGADGGSDGDGSSGHCSTSADCPSGQTCYFPIAEGCAATGTCLTSASCTGNTACACDGTTKTLIACGPSGYAEMPVQYVGPCQDAAPPPTLFDSGTSPCGSSIACELCDVSGYVPDTLAKPKVVPNACTPTEMTSFAAACLAPNATAQTCQAWQAVEGDAGSCAPCIFTLQPSASWGAVVCASTSCTLNTPGCVDLVLHQVGQEKAAGGSGSCGDLVSASYGCQDYACSTCAPSDFAACDQSAIANECKSYVDPVDSLTGPCATLNGDGGAAAAVCFPQSSSDMASFVNVFCGSGP